MEPSHSALIVTVPEAEPVVAAHRQRLDAAASWGVPAHVTVLFPFLPPAAIDERVLRTLGRAAATVPAFFVALERVGWFGDRAVWLAPSPAEPFQQLTAAVTARFPGVRPYEGAFEEVVPHLTVGADRPVGELTAAGEAVAARLPIRARVDTLRLITGRREPGDSWLTRALFPLG
ncbi:2'-5' RNA ligase family protein [Actinoplanes sp. KI2]|uniref:2'-5' RNA ligase family protein n=1 Tax=Actinoplanes sp. KI2 TaxID=2983315 RepID=UPI0021D56D28|nr:2'-5' RNA ligase family protein [Actinoplanes sp. KI2]MCU7722531.1 2'-5' RNA ligase family protein [Actinoplanes sp. KI2]